MKNFKSLFIALAIAFGISTTNAQSKVAHIDVSELMKEMPDMKAAQAQLETVQKTYDTEYETMVNEYQTKMKKYQAEVETVTEATNESRSKEMQEMGARIQQYKETASKELEKKYMDLLKPIQDKALASIQKVARAKGFEYVLDASTGSGLLMADGPNLLEDVRKDLATK